MKSSIPQTFVQDLLQWYQDHGRHDLPWQSPYCAYRVWVSEIMLQQTQVKTVIPYFEKFMHVFPRIEDLANASEESVLTLWAGLGYYRRARMLHQTAKIIQCDHYGKFPQEAPQLRQFPGIGPSTAAAISSLAFNRPYAIFDGNVKRVLARYHRIDAPLGSSVLERTCQQMAQASIQTTQKCREYTQAMMDLGALCCTPKKPNCTACPLQRTCSAFQNNQTDQYPRPKAKLKRATQVWTLYLLTYRHAKEEAYLHLEKRPVHGIWGGLWCPPTNTTERFKNEEFRRYLSSFPSQELPSLKHRLTHLDLELQPRLIHVDSIEPYVDQCNWFRISALEQLALPKPIQDLLNSIGYIRTPPMTQPTTEQQT